MEHSFHTSDPVVSANAGRKNIDSKNVYKTIERGMLFLELYKQLEGFVANLSPNMGVCLLAPQAAQDKACSKAASQWNSKVHHGWDYLAIHYGRGIACAA